MRPLRFGRLLAVIFTLFTLQANHELQSSGDRLPAHGSRLWQQAPERVDDLPVEINFGRESGHSFVTARELRDWAQPRNLALLPDCPQRDMHNGEAAVIAQSGLDLTLHAPGNGRIFLWLDLVTFLPAELYEPERGGDYCRRSLNEGGTNRSQGRPMPVGSSHDGFGYLEVIVNGHRVETIISGGGVFPVTPVVVEIRREDIIERRLEVTLRPSPSAGSSHAIWDIFVSRHSGE